MVKRLLLILSIPLLYACSEDDTSTVVEENLVSHSLRFGRSQSEALNLLADGGFTEIDSYFIYDIDIFEIIYETEYLGETIEVSGLVAFPDTNEPMPMLSFQHGTIASNEEAPTENVTYSVLSGFASMGYIFMIPDFIGFGNSSDILHPYYNKALSASTVLDMVTAVKELAYIEGYTLNNDLFLAGYSEGGYVTLAAHQAYENNPLEDIELIVSAPAAGGYDVKGVQEYFFSQTTYLQPFFLPYVYLSYASTNTIDLEPSDLFNEPYASEISDLFDGSLDGSRINAQLTTTISDLLTEEFLSGVNTNSKYDGINEAFENNSIDEWIPEIPLILYHGDADVTVPYQNSVDVYEKLLDLGTSTDNLDFITFEGATHTTGVAPYLEDVIKKFETYR